MEDQLLGDVDRFDVGQCTEQRTASYGLVRADHVAGDHPLTRLLFAVDEFGFGLWPYNMVAIVVAIGLVDRRLDELHVFGRLVLDDCLELLRDRGVGPCLDNGLALDLELAEHGIDLAVGALLETHEILGHRLKTYRRRFVARRYPHAPGADCQVEKHLAHGQVKVALTQDREHLFAIHVERGLDAFALLRVDVVASG